MTPMVMNLCIADDEPIIRQGLTSLPWDTIEFTVVAEVDNGLDAIEVLQTEVVDVILADIRMPGLDGIGLARYVADEHLNTRVVLLSGHGDFGYAQQAITHRVASYLLKPSNPDEILAVVAEAGDQVARNRAADLRLKLLEAELGRRQLVLDDRGLILGEVSHSDVADKVLSYLVERFREPISLSMLSSDLHFSSIYLSRVIKRATGYTFLELLNGLRVQDAARQLRSGSRSFPMICDRVGASDARYFSQVFKRAYGVTPTAYRAAPTPPLDARLAIYLATLHRDEGA
ncbi:MAG: response regulator [Propionibacteriaceae bacterium]|nr:response regulator [Propionibacteriaceae bacterium]